MPPSPVCKFSEGELIDQPWGRLTWLVSRQLGNSATMTFGRVVIPAHQTNPRHRHPNCDEILHVLSGRLEHSLGDMRYVLERGTRFRFRPVNGTTPARWTVSPRKW